MRHVKPHGMLYNQAARSTTGRRHRQSVYACDQHGSRRAGRKRADWCRQAIWPDNARRQCLPIAVIRLTTRWCGEASQAR
ncbi:hypothetical protein ACNKHP_21365 [Shigella boydii]